MNNWFAVGRLTRDLNVSNAGSKKMVKGSLIPPGPKNMTPNVIPFIAFDKTAEILAEYANTKGTMIGVSGHMQSRTVEGKFYLDHVADRVTLCGSNKNSDHVENDDCAIPEDLMGKLESSVSIGNLKL